jgi:effector-binding domain-containing protein
MTLTKKQKRNLFYSSLAAIITITVLLAKFYFSRSTSISDNHKSNDTIQPIVQTPTITSINKDSSKQTINQLNQVNQNKGDVKNEIVNGDKIESQKNYYTNTEPKAPAKRHVTKNDIKVVEAKIPKDYIISLWYCFSDNECAQYGQELVNKLIDDGYTIQTNAYGSIAGGNYNDRFDISSKDDDKTATITVYVLKEK